MSNTTPRQPNYFYKSTETVYVGSYISLQVELHDLTLTFSHTSRNSNEVWILTTPSPRTGVEFPIGTATYMQPEAVGESPYFLGRIEDPSGINVPFKISPADPNDLTGPWTIRYNPPMTGAVNAPAQQAGQQRSQRGGYGQQRPTTLGPSRGIGGFNQSTFGGPAGHAFNGSAPNGFAGNGHGQDEGDVPFGG